MAAVLFQSRIRWRCWIFLQCRSLTYLLRDLDGGTLPPGCERYHIIAWPFIPMHILCKYFLEPSLASHLSMRHRSPSGWTVKWTSFSPFSPRTIKTSYRCWLEYHKSLVYFVRNLFFVREVVNYMDMSFLFTKCWHWCHIHVHVFSAPQVAPQSLKLSATTSNCITFSWEPPEFANKLMSYQVRPQACVCFLLFTSVDKLWVRVMPNQFLF